MTCRITLLLLVVLPLSPIFAQQHELSVQIPEGNSIVSINVLLPQEFYRDNEDRGPDVRLMFNQLRTNENYHRIFLIESESGGFYAPHIREFCTIPYWDVQTGYFIQAREDCEATWVGELIPPDTDIQLDPAWNVISYFPTYELDAGAPDFYVLSPIIDQVLYAKDDHGGFMDVRNNFSNMEPWREGEGYVVCIDAEEPIILNYPEEQEQEPFQPWFADHWNIDVLSMNTMNILVTSIAGIEPLQGDQIAAFRIDNENPCGTGAIQENGMCGITIWGNDPGIRDDVDFPGPQEMFTLRYWSEVEQIEFGVEVTQFIDGEALRYADNAVLTIEVEVGLNPDEPDQQLLEIHFEEGINWISHNIIFPENIGVYRDDEYIGANVELMMDEYPDFYGVIKDGAGAFWARTVNLVFCNLSPWHYSRVLEGELGQDDEAVLSWEGEPVPFDTEITFNSDHGRLIPYYPNYRLNSGPEDFYVLSPIIDQVIIARDDNGHILVPEFGFSDMPPWRPGEGYIVRVELEDEEPLIFQYPEEQEGEPFQPWAGINWDRSSVEKFLELVTEIGGINAEEGDQIAGLIGDDSLYCIGDVQASGMCAMAFIGDTSTVERYIYWDASEQREISLEVVSVDSTYIRTLELANPESVSDNSIVPPTSFGLSVYPNPFNSSTTISYSLPSPADVNLAVLDLSGRKVAQLVSGNVEAGSHSVVWDAVGVPTGVYVIRLSNAEGKTAQIQKCILVK